MLIGECSVERWVATASALVMLWRVSFDVFWRWVLWDDWGPAEILVVLDPDIAAVDPCFCRVMIQWRIKPC